MSNQENNKKETTVYDVLKMQKRVSGIGIFLMVIGCIGTVIVLCSIVWYAYYQVKYYSSIKLGVVIYYLISLVVLGCMVSGGAYMYKTSKVIKTGLKKKMEEGSNVEEK